MATENLKTVCIVVSIYWRVGIEQLKSRPRYNNQDQAYAPSHQILATPLHMIGSAVRSSEPDVTLSTSDIDVDLRHHLVVVIGFIWITGSLNFNEHANVVNKTLTENREQVSAW